tara:strand:- start:563 stop:1486 length:924 start_codon:yes stop_codon:yes gene_type:complete
MTTELLIEQFLNGLQFGFMLFLMSAGLTLIFGVMGLINLAHGSFYMIGAFSAATVFAIFNSFWLALIASFFFTAAIGVVVEKLIISKLYNRDHLDQVLATFALILVFSESIRWIFGAFPLYLDVPDFLNGSVEIFWGVFYSKYRLFIIFLGLIIAVFLFLLIGKTNLGIKIRAGQYDREMISVLGVDISKLYTFLFGVGAALAGLAGALIGTIQSVEVGMGEPILILAFVVIVIGGIGSIKGALIASLLVGLVDTLGRFFIPWILQSITNPSDAMSIGSAIGSMLIYILMAIVLILKPTGLYGKQLS